MTSADILVRISTLKGEIESRQKEIDFLKEELKEIGRDKIRKMKERAEKMASFIKRNQSREIVIKFTTIATSDDEETIEEKQTHTIAPNTCRVYKTPLGDWVLRVPNRFVIPLTEIEELHVIFKP